MLATLVLKYIKSQIRGHNKNYQPLLFLLLLVSTFELIVECKKDSVSNEHFSTEKFLIAIFPICRKPFFESLTKPKGIRMGIFENSMVPYSCVESVRNRKISKACEVEEQRYEIFLEKSDKSKINMFAEARLLDGTQRDNYKIIILNKLDTLARNVKQPSVITPNALAAVSQFLNIRYLADTVKYAENLKLSDCGEHAARDLLQLLRLDDTLKLQHVFLKDDKRASTHYYVLINSNLPDIDIKNEPKKVSNYFAKLKRGFICDSWNEAYVNSVTKNKNNLYQDLKWTSITVTTYSKVFDFSELLSNQVEFLVNELAAIGIKVIKHPQDLQSSSDHLKMEL